MLNLLITSVPGVEDIVVEELEEYVKLANVTILSLGKLLITLDKTNTKRFLLNISRLRSVERVILILFDDVLKESALNEIASVVVARIKEKRTIFEYMTPFVSYSVKVKRTGVHRFTSIDVARVIGDVISSIMNEVTKKRVPVRLECPDIRFHVEVIEDRLLFGIDITGPRPLHERGYKVYLHPSSLNPIIAYAMVKLAKVRPGHRVLDPMCGSATILIECGLCYDDVELYGVDINPEFLKGAEINVREAGIKDKVKLFLGDATSLESLFPQNYFDRVLSNLPYGIRTGSPYNIQELYSQFLSSVRRVIKDDSLLVLLTVRKKALEKAIKLNDFKKVKVKTIEQGGLYPRIYLLRP